MFQNADNQKWQRVPRLTPLCVESLGVPSDVSHTLLDMCLNKTYIVSDGFNFKSINKLSLFSSHSPMYCFSYFLGGIKAILKVADPQNRLIILNLNCKILIF